MSRQSPFLRWSERTLSAPANTTLARLAALVTTVGVTGVLGGCTSSPNVNATDVDPTEGTLNLTVDRGSAQHLPVVCTGHRSFTGDVDSSGSYPALGARLSATLTSSSSATIDVSVQQYKSTPLPYQGTASVSLTSTDGPVGSLEGTATEVGGGGSVHVSAQFHCSAAGGGVYVASGGVEGVVGSETVAIYFTVSHDGQRIVDLVANTIGGQWDHFLPNVQLRAANVAVAADGTFSVTAPVVAEDPTGRAAAGRPATLLGKLDRFGGASGSVKFPDSVHSTAYPWTGSVAGPIPTPTFPHAPLDTPDVSAAAIAANPAINQVFPGSTNLDGTAPGPPAAAGETPHETWANLAAFNFFDPWNSAPAEAVRQQRTAAGVYEVAAWYTTRLTALGWAAADTTGPGSYASLVFLQGHHRRLVVSFTNRVAGALDYELDLDESSPDTDVLDKDDTPGAPQSIPPCDRGEPATITVSGTLSGTSATTCITDLSPSSKPSCGDPSVGMAIGEVRLDVRSSPYGSAYASLDVTDKHWHVTELRPVSPPLQSVDANRTLHISGSYSGDGYRETVTVVAACT